jgi:hypothetical protein
VPTKGPAVSRAIASIPNHAWTSVGYPGAVIDPDTGRLISDAEVAETIPTAVATTKPPWVLCAAICHSPLRAAGTLTSGQHATARGASLRRQRDSPARLASPQRRRVPHLPAHWPWAEQSRRPWRTVFGPATGPQLGGQTRRSADAARSSRRYGVDDGGHDARSHAGAPRTDDNAAAGRVAGAARARSSTVPAPAGQRSNGTSRPRGAGRRSRSVLPGTGIAG